VDDTGAPVAGASVNFEPVADPSDDSFNLAEFIGTFSGGGEKAIQTDDEGYFTFTNMKPGAYTFRARSASKGSGSSDPMTLTSGNGISGLTIRLEPGIVVEGTVVDATGAPLPAAAITLVAKKGDGPNDMMANYLPGGMQEKEASATSGAEGEFRLDNIAPGTYTLTADHLDFATTRDTKFMATAGQNIFGYKIMLTEGGSVTGFAAIGGVAKAGYMVQLVGESGMHMATSDESGHFELGTIAPGTYMATAVDISRVTSGNMAGATSTPIVVDIVDGETVELDFSPPANAVSVGGTLGGELGTITTITLRIEGGPLPEELDPMDPGAQVEAVRYMAGMAMAGPDGAFDLGGIEPGTYILEAYTMDLDFSDIDAMINADRTPQIRQTIEIVAGEPVTLDLEFPPR
jgi:protocatechuate 3,4-dioxygenase beta subunit